MAEKFHETLTQERLKEILHYDPETGVFTWLRCKPRGRYKPGDVAGSVSHNGYIDLCIDQRRFKAHRLAWLYVHGRFPEYLLDHINRVGTDNRIANLREADRASNGWNASLKRNNTSGVTGVSFDRRRGMWAAEIFVRGKKHSLGHYADKADAVTARFAAETMHYGEFAPQAAA